jgi:DNA gyrase subunit A
MATPSTQEENTVTPATIQEQALDHFMEDAYRRYAVLTILDRALPDARDGLKPVQRRILYAMHDMNLDHSGPHRKSARVVGEVLGKYHPHGDSSVYDAMVRLAQDFTMRMPLIDGQGNYGSIDGDGAAAMRYTEARLSAIGETMLEDLEKDTVNWRDNFDGSLKEPIVLPNRFPNLLVNGTTGIAVGMSTNILPHNLGEVCDAVAYMAQNWKRVGKITASELMKFIPGPDLPTGGIIYRYRVNGDEKKVDMIAKAYETGNATLVCQAKYDTQDIGGGKSQIIVTELPFQAQKNTILERIAANRDKFTGISDVRDESDFNGMRVVFEITRGTDPKDVIDRLLTHTQMRASLSYNALALTHDSDGKASPKTLTLSNLLSEFIHHRLEVIIRRSRFELAKAKARQHILVGLLKALSMIDEVVSIIRHSQTSESAKTNLMKKLDLTEIQAQAILDMPLRRLVSLERKKLEDEHRDLTTRIKELEMILASETKRLEIVADETLNIKTRYATPRKTVIVESEEGHQANITVTELALPTEPQLVLVFGNRIQRLPTREYKENVPTGKASTRPVDLPLFRFKLEPEQKLLLVTNKGRIWHGHSGRLPLEATNNQLGLTASEKIISVDLVETDQKLILVTSSGNVKRINPEDCLTEKTAAVWTTVIGVDNGKDQVLIAGTASEAANILIATSGNDKVIPRVLRFEASLINPQATPTARGVTAIKMLGDALIGGAIIEPQGFKGFSLLLTQRGHLKKISLEDFPMQGRGGQGVQTWKINESTGPCCAFTTCTANQIVDIYSEKGRRIRINLKEIAPVTRVGKGIDLGARFEKGGLFGEEAAKGIVII